MRLAPVAWIGVAAGAAGHLVFASIAAFGTAGRASLESRQVSRSSDHTVGIESDSLMKKSSLHRSDFVVATVVGVALALAQGDVLLPESGAPSFAKDGIVVGVSAPCVLLNFLVRRDRPRGFGVAALHALMGGMLGGIAFGIADSLLKIAAYSG